MSDPTSSGPSAETPEAGEGDRAPQTEQAAQAGQDSIFYRLYTGTGAFDIIGRRRIWYMATAALFVICITSILVRGFNPGIEFEGGSQFRLPATGANGAITTQDVRSVYTQTFGQPPASVQNVGSGAAESVMLRSQTLRNQQVIQLRTALFEQLGPLGADGAPTIDAITDSKVSGTWGGQITQQALVALVVFLALVSVFLGIYFEPRMALGALAALAFDLGITAGVYSMVGFTLTPATVIGLLTILGYSLYDTVVVFDKVRENTRGLLGLTRRTFGEAANLAVNQTMMRSINTSLTSVLPVLSLLAIGAGLLGAGTLKDLALVLMVGLLAGTISSIFLATPVAVDLTMRRDDYREQAERVAARRANQARKAADQQVGADPSATPSGAAGAQPAMAGASGVPGVPDRVGKAGPPRRSRSRTGRPSAKSSRPSGKKQR